MKIATWNVNSIKARLPHVLTWLAEARPDVALLQETKTVDETFPALEIGDLGYNIAMHGQKTYNGVAILAKSPIEDVTRALPGGEADEQARYIEAVVGEVRVASVYVPNGGEVGSDKFAYKLKWLDRLRAHARDLLAYEEAFVIGGDYNVAPRPQDVHDPARLDGTTCYHPEERRRFRAIVNLGLTDAFTALNPEPNQYSWWDYRGGAWNKDLGLRIDHLLLSPQAADRLSAGGIERALRGREKASDHVPVWCGLDE